MTVAMKKRDIENSKPKFSSSTRYDLSESPVTSSTMAVAKKDVIAPMKTLTNHAVKALMSQLGT